MKAFRRLKLSLLIITLLASVVVTRAVAAEKEKAAKLSQEEKKAGNPKPFKNVNVAEFEQLRADKKNVVLDVRTPAEFAAGHIPGAIHIDVNGPDFDKKVAALDKSKVYLVHCAAGVRSAKACTAMNKLDFKSLFNLEGGMKAWEKAGHQPEK
jgi:phage shock protein E